MLNKFSLRQWLIGGCAIWCFTVGMLARAEVVLDGTLGQGGALPGPDYLIGAKLGERHGGNLFHSFQYFNLDSGEIATFSGPNSINNIISRVTGGKSSIDGTIRSTITNADMYLLNPNGILFGPNAKLDVQGSFHASTADYLRLRNGGRFDARNPGNSLLTIEPVEAFGFLGNSGDITVEGLGEIYEDLEKTGLEVPEGQTLSLIGGNLTIKNGAFFKTSIQQGDKIIEITKTKPNLSAPSGGINLISVASGEVISGDESDGYFVDVSSFTKLAEIYIGNGLVQTNNAVKTNTDGIGINVKAGQLTLNDGRLVAETRGAGNGGDITIDVTGKVKLKGKRMPNPNDLTGELITLISTRTHSENKNATGGKVELNVGELEITEGRQIGSLTRGNSKGGDININASRNISINGTGSMPFTMIGAESDNTGEAGNIILKAKEDIILKNFAMISSASKGTGKSGNINLVAKRLALSNVAQVGSATFGFGQGGNINIDMAERIEIFGTNSPPIFNKITAVTLGEKKAGSIVLTTNELIMDDSLQSIETSTFGAGKGGYITIDANYIWLTDGSFISAASLSFPPRPDVKPYKGPFGDAGNIKLNVIDWLRMQNGSYIKTSAENSGGGKIDITSRGYLYLTRSEISSSVHKGGKDGGNIKLTPKLIVLEDRLGNDKDSYIIEAQADSGKGGNIDITTSGIYAIQENRYEYYKNFMDASSKTGIHGIITVNSPEENLDEAMLRKKRPFLIDKWSMNRCAGRTREDLSSFVIITRDTLPETPLDLRTHIIFVD